jgi:hypothetical protein
MGKVAAPHRLIADPAVARPQASGILVEALTAKPATDIAARKNLLTLTTADGLIGTFIYVYAP